MLPGVNPKVEMFHPAYSKTRNGMTKIVTAINILARRGCGEGTNIRAILSGNVKMEKNAK
jgi:hypothetical protein